MSTPPTPPSGAQYELAAGDYRATVVEVGGGVRSCTYNGRPVLDPYPFDAMCDGAHGTPLIPWPNRLADGRYRFDGADYQVALTEPEKHNAIHGFLCWRAWQAREQASDRIIMATRLYPLPGYPFMLDVEVEYLLTDGGLTARTTATNIGEAACPYACGQHPYLSPGAGLIDDCELELAAGTRITTSADRQLPTGREPVAGTPFDFRLRRHLGHLPVDYAFTDLTRDAGGRAWVRLHGTDGATAQLWVDAGYPIVEIYTGDTLSPDRRRRGLGAEPMTGPPNAFQTGEQLIRLEPGSSATCAWGVQLVSSG
jgi:aldose 1-epimerase